MDKEMNAAELMCCKSCGKSYIVSAPLDYVDSGLCNGCTDEAKQREIEWLNQNIGADAIPFPFPLTDAYKFDRGEGQWGAFVVVMALLATASVVFYFVPDFVSWVRR